MKESIEKHKKLFFGINILIGFIIYTVYKFENSYTIEDHIAGFVGFNIMLLIYVIYKSVKKQTLDVWVFAILVLIPILLIFFEEWQKSLFTM